MDCAVGTCAYTYLNVMCKAHVTALKSSATYVCASRGQSPAPRPYLVRSIFAVGVSKANMVRRRNEERVFGKNVSYTEKLYSFRVNTEWGLQQVLTSQKVNAGRPSYRHCLISLIWIVGWILVYFFMSLRMVSMFCSIALLYSVTSCT